MPHDARGREIAAYYATAFTLVSAILLGGGTHAGFLSDVVLQLTVLPLLLLALWKLSRPELSRPADAALTIVGCIALLPLLQLLPLPPAVWSALPGHADLAESYRTLGRPLPWMPLSVSPQSTVLVLASLIVPVAVFLGTLQLSLVYRRRLSVLVLALGFVSIILGLLQLAQGESSPLRFYAFTNVNEAVGFFANRNHFAALLYCLCLFTAAWTIESARRVERAPERDRFALRSMGPLLASVTVLVALLAAQAMARSRAGLGLSMLAVAAVFLLAYPERRRRQNGLASKLLAAAVAVGLLFSAQFAFYRVLERFAADPLSDYRLAFARTTLEAAKSLAPFGSGMGTFVPIYAKFEKLEDTMMNTYVNRAHNDYLELLLESGVVGVVLLALVGLWYLRRLPAIWRPAHHAAIGDAAAGPPLGGIDLLLARAATLVIAFLALHSFVDYPLRTGAMSAVLAFAAALLVPPPAGSYGAAEQEVAPEPARASSRRSSRHEYVPHRHNDPPPSEPRPAPPVPSAAPQSSRPAALTPWGTNWPDAWSNPQGRADGKPRPPHDKGPGKE